VDLHDLGLTGLHNEDDQQTDLASQQSEFYDIFERLIVQPPLDAASTALPRYDYTHVRHPEVGTREDLPSVFQIHVHYEPYYAPFPVTVRPDMNISDLITQLSYLFNTKRVFSFSSTTIDSALIASVFKTCVA
jgi:hypothetical protein